MNERGAFLGQVAFVTGASSGLGWATALALGRAGAGVALLARSASDLAAVADELRGDGYPALPVDTTRSMTAEAASAHAAGAPVDRR